VIRRLIALILLIWLLGLAWFIVSLPGPADKEQTDAIVVLTGGKGRIERGIELMAKKQAKRMLVSGVYPPVRKAELALVQKAPLKLFACCIDLGKEAVDTRTNAGETQRWLKRHKFRSVRLITSDWHMARAHFELERRIGTDATIINDAVSTAPSLTMLFTEYNKMLARRITAFFGF
jgi:uncharacterized SAM-binding protein YcdF (DUF218 family)